MMADMLCGGLPGNGGNMRILLIRHGDPDYVHDSLTEKGKREAGLLADRLVKTDIDRIYVSSMGRAMETAGFYLEKAGRKADAVYDWMREFGGMCIRPDKGEMIFCWDWLPGEWTAEPLFFEPEGWKKAEAFKGTNVVKEYERVSTELDRLLAGHGYVRDGELYRAERPNNDTIALFCHFGVGSVMLSHLLNIPPMVFWHGFAAAPTSVSVITTEERREGTAYFRMSSYGDISHLYAGDEEPSFSARFCECYANTDERHD